MSNIRKVGEKFTYDGEEIIAVKGHCEGCCIKENDCYDFWEKNNECRSASGNCLSFLKTNELQEKKQSPWNSVTIPPTHSNDVLLKYVWRSKFTGLEEDVYDYIKARYEDEDWITSLCLTGAELVSWMEIPE